MIVLLFDHRVCLFVVFFFHNNQMTLLKLRERKERKQKIHEMIIIVLAVCDITAGTFLSLPLMLISVYNRCNRGFHCYHVQSGTMLY